MPGCGNPPRPTRMPTLLSPSVGFWSDLFMKGSNGGKKKREEIEEVEEEKKKE